MACGQPDASGIPAGTSCSTSCWNNSAENNQHRDEGSTGTCTRSGGVSESWVRERDNCKDGCTNRCAKCSGNCTAACDSGCGGACSSGCSGCQGCGGACSSSCSGCSGQCKGGCQGSCNGKCNTGCTNEEQVNNSKVILDRIVNVDNVKDIFKFVLYEIKRRNKTANTSTINKLSAWTPEDEAKLFLLFYNLPRLFEDTFDSVNKDVKKQSATLVYEMGEWVSKYLNKSQVSENPQPEGNRPSTPSEGTKPYNYNLPQYEQGQHGFNQEARRKNPWPSYETEENTYSLNIDEVEEKEEWVKSFLRELESSVSGEEISNQLNEYWKSTIPYDYYIGGSYPSQSNNTKPTQNNSTEQVLTPKPNSTMDNNNYSYNSNETAKHYADKMSALDWIEKARELYNEKVPVQDAKD